jgi:hypothetical protein
MAINDGGYAFPHPALANEGFSPQYDMGGMSLRDYFAAKALCGVALWQRGQGGSFFNPDDAKDAAKLAYQLADAMLLARGGVK